MNSAVDSVQGAGEHEGCGDGGAACLCSCWVVLGLLGVGDSDVGPDLGLCEHEGCGEGGAACPCSCWTASSWATGGL